MSITHSPKGTTSIIGLTDVDDGAFAGDAGDLVAVNAGETAVEFIDVGSGLQNASGALSLTNTGVSAGTYFASTVTVDAKGRITAASNGDVDYSFTATGVAADDLTALNLAISTVAASAGNRKTIRVRGNFACGTTVCTDPDYITLIFDRIVLTGSPSTAWFEGVDCIVHFEGLALSGGTVGSQGMFHVAEVHGTIESTWSGDVFGNVASSPSITSNVIKLRNLSANATFNFDSADYNAALIEINGVAKGNTTAGNGNGSFRDYSGSKSGAAHTLSLSTSVVQLARCRNLTVTGADLDVTAASAGSAGGSSFSHNISGDGVALRGPCHGAGTTFTVSGDNVIIDTTQDGDGDTTLVMSGINPKVRTCGANIVCATNTSVNGKFHLEETATGTPAAQTWTIGTRNDWNVNSGISTVKRTLATSSGSTVNLTLPGDASADAVEIAATCDNTVFNIVLTASGSGVQIMAGATNNKIFVAGDTAPTFETAQAKYENSTTWLNTSTGQVTHYGQGPGKIVKHVTAANIVALGAVTAGNISIGTLPIGAKVTRGYILNLGSAATGVSTLTAQAGIAATPNLYVTDSTVYAANAVSETLGTATVDHQATAAAIVRFSAAENLDTLTGLANGIAVVLDYLE
ncbi:MAG: hypothetical protein HUU29_00285 [Planctomycetaceae bacterium]|nr:hypothetical protein [Planctomycetaceae bacterium]